eukprot:TRINITY_DN12803_c0_g1_i1.p1 TRINITY_DN12803_c0_g1~~TRINITY_DN12803_c0_g1_i1.p1  ORF type:complete len:184 (-),score=20.22 TRINITY_DN12803_c0_g1_i1:98-649(-)
MLPPLNGISPPMQTIARLLKSYVEYKGWDDLEGIRQTEIDDVWLYRSSEGNQRQHFTYHSGIIMLGQGKKNITIGDRPVTYAAGDYLVVGVPMPLECEALPIDGEPLLGLSINIDSQRLHSLVKKLEDQGFLESYCNKHKQNSSGLESTPMEEQMLDSFTRLIKALHCDIEANILGDVFFVVV